MSNPNAIFPNDVRTTDHAFRAKLRELKTWLERLKNEFDDQDHEGKDFLRQRFSTPDRFPGFNPALFDTALLTLKITISQTPGAAGGRKSRRFKHKSRRR